MVDNDRSHHCNFSHNNEVITVASHTELTNRPKLLPIFTNNMRTAAGRVEVIMMTLLMMMMTMLWKGWKTPRNMLFTKLWLIHTQNNFMEPSHGPVISASFSFSMVQWVSSCCLMGNYLQLLFKFGLLDFEAFSNQHCALLSQWKWVVILIDLSLTKCFFFLKLNHFYFNKWNS